MPSGANPPARAGTIAVERVLGVAEGGSTVATGAITLPTSFVPVTVRGRYEGAGNRRNSIGLSCPIRTGVLLDAQVDPVALAALRARYRSTATALALLVLACTMLVVSVPVEEWRRRRGTWTELAIAAGVLLALLFTARALVAAAVPVAWRWPDAADAPVLLRILFRSPLDVLATGAVLLTIVALAADLLERRRLRARHRPVPRAMALSMVAFASTHLAAGLVLALILFGHYWLLARLLVHASLNPVQFSLHPFEPLRLAFVLGVLALHAATLWAAVVTLRFAAQSWRVSPRARPARLAMAGLWLLPVSVGVLLGTPGDGGGHAPMLVAAVVAVALTALVRWVAPRYRHGSQVFRLLAAFLALAVPALVFNPTLVELTERATEGVIRDTLGPQVLAHRQQLQIQVRESLRQIDGQPRWPSSWPRRCGRRGSRPRRMPPSASGARPIWRGSASPRRSSSMRPTERSSAASRSTCRRSRPPPSSGWNPGAIGTASASRSRAAKIPRAAARRARAVWRR